MQKFLNSLRLLNKNIWLYILADGFYYAGYSVVDAFLSVLITVKLAPGRVDLVGFVIGYYMLTRSIAEIPISRITRRFNSSTKRNLVSVSYLIYGGLVMLMGYSTSLVQIFIIQTFAGIIDAMVYPLKWPLFAKSIDKEEELAWSLEDIAATALPAGFTMLAGLAATAFGMQAPFIIFGILLITSGTIFRFVRPPANNLDQLVTAEHVKTLRYITSTLKENRIHFQISGGLAAMAYGARNRPLADIDVDIYKKDVIKIKKLFSKYIIRPFSSYKDEQFDIFLMTLKINSILVDFSQVEDMYFLNPHGKKRRESVDLESAETVKFLDLIIPIEKKENLIDYKKFIAREVDRKDVEEIG